MRETNFIDQNKRKWIKFEKVLKDSKKDPEELSNLFVEITDDLSYSRTFYPNRSVRVYLNNVAQRVFYNIYRNRKSRLRRFWQFWRDDVPQILFESRFDLFLSLGIFLLAAFIGVFSSMMDPEFARIVLGDGYIEMTLENIENGTPMSVYQDPEQTNMFLRIAFNNLMVAFITFAFGLLFGGGTIYLLIVNGIMVGTFQYFFIQRGIYWDSILTIWMHGAIEISAIVIAGAAGIHLGRGLLFPGTFTRLQGLQLSARRALLIYITLVPLIILAAFIEGFITRYSDAPYLVRGLLIALSFAFMFFYFIWYPYRKAKRGFTANLREVNLPPTRDMRITFNKIKSSGQIFTDAFTFYRKNLKQLAVLAAILGFVYTAIAMNIEQRPEFMSIRFNYLWQLFTLFFEALYATLWNGGSIFFRPHFDLFWWMNVVIFSTMAYYTLHRISMYAGKEKPKTGYYIQTIAGSLTIGIAFNALMVTYQSPGMYGLIFLFVLFLLPMLILWLSVIFNERVNIVTALGRMFSMLGGNWPTMMGAYIVMFIMCLVFLFLGTAPLNTFYAEAIVTLFPFGEETAGQFLDAFLIFINSFLISFMFPLLFSALSIAQYSFRETKQANELFDQIPEVGVRKQSYGMERE